MRKRILSEGEQYIEKQRKRRCWRRWTAVLSLAVVCWIAYVMILPAITMEHTEEVPVAAETEIPTPEEDSQPEEETETPAPEGDPQPEEETETPAPEEEPQPEEETGTPAPEEVPTVENPVPVGEMQKAEREAVVTEPLKVEDYVSEAKLYYQDSQNQNWTEITEGTTGVPGDASFKLEIKYQQVPLATLKGAGGKMIYSLPDIFRDAKAGGDIISGSEKVGEITTNEDKVTLAFDLNWIEKLIESKETVLKEGTLEVIAAANLIEIPPDGNANLVIGKVNIKINFEEDLIAQNGEIHLEKQFVELKETADGDFLKYTLTVKAGKDGCPDVSITDKITTATDYVENSFKIEGAEAANVAVDGLTFTWTIGNMEPNATKTLTYLVKLKDTYLGGAAQTPLTNIAAVFSKKYSRETASATFTPQAKATLTKAAGEYIPNEEKGGGTIQYTVWVKADANNNYTLDNVTIWDALDGSVSGWNGEYTGTDTTILEYLSYDAKSFQLYKGGEKDQNGSSGLGELIENPAGVQIKEGEKNFKYSVGDLEPGECRTLVYKVNVDAGIDTIVNGQEILIRNRATIMTDPSRKDGGGIRLENFTRFNYITVKKWSRKFLGSKIEVTKIIPMENGNSFTVPQGSYQYQVVVNETGDWDISSAILKDSLTQGKEHMQYVGWLQIDAYEGITYAEGNKLTQTTEDSSIAEELKKQNPKDTKWIKIDGQTSFEIKPEDLNFFDKNNAYLLTYYAVPINMTGVKVSNQFSINGSVGIGDKTYPLGILVEANVTVKGDNYFSANKNFWYYETNAEPPAEKGALYWILKIEGGMIPKDTQLKDTVIGENHRVETVVKAFTAATIENISDYENLEELQQAPEFKNFTDHSSNTTENELIITLTENVTLQKGSSLYFVVSTLPNALPETIGSHIQYQNELQTKDPAESADWIKQSQAEYTLTSGGNIYKELGMVFTAAKNAEGKITENDITLKDGTKDTVLQYDQLTQAGGGIYVAWKVNVNKGSTLSGRYRIKEQVPEGMEVVYIQRYSWDHSIDPKFVEQSDLKNEGYKEVEKNYSVAYDNTPIPTYYYVKGQEVIWDVEGLKANPSNPGKNYVIFLVVCKLTDEEVLLDGKKKEFNNQVEIYNTVGKKLGDGSNSVELEAVTLSKTGIYKDTNGGRYPFEITLNENGTDLLKNETTITLVDEMCDILTLDPQSIKVVNTKTQDPVTVTSSLDPETNVLKIELPDDQPLTITYEAAINAAPGQKIDISNKAYWYGHERDGAVVEKKDFSYAVSGTVTTGTTPKVKITKIDENALGVMLSGAEFSLQEMKIEKGQLIAAKTDSFTGTTGTDGTLVFGESGNVLAFDTIYCLTETEPPKGYVLNPKPQYFLIASPEKTFNEEEKEELENCGVKIYYGGAEYAITVYNHKGEIWVKKAFQNAAGESLTKPLKGTYTFGLFEQIENELKKVQEIKISYKGTDLEELTGSFKNVDFGKNYKVYELDDKGKPIESDAEGIVSGMPFIVTYKNNEVTVSTEKPTAETTVTNRMNYAELPASGGLGSEICTVSGAVLVAGASGLLGVKIKRRRKHADHTEI